MKGEIVLYGTVGESLWGEEYFTARDVRAQLDGRSGPVTVRINSGGGIATEGQAIYTALKDYPDEVEVIVDGVAASAASLIAMAGTRITMRLGSWMLVHDPSSLLTQGRGTAEDHTATANFLDKLGEAYAEVYAARTGKDKEEMRAIMRAETLFLGAEAVEAGFADAFEGDKEAAAAAAFDYRIYAHAPESARKASERLGDKLGHKALAAIIAGSPRVQQEAIMADTKKAAAEAPTAEMKAPEVEAPKAEAPKPSLSVSQVTRLYSVAEKAGVSAAKVGEIVASTADFETALDRVSALWKAQGDADIPMPGAPTARILRDERETRRDGMTEAVASQVERRAPADERARAFMSMSLAEMAATCADYRGPLRTTGDKIEAFRMAHSTSDFPAIFENALNKSLLARYQAAQPTYREIAARRTFNDFRPHPMVRAGDFPMMKEVSPEGGQMEAGTFSESKESVSVKAYGVTVGISLAMLVNDDMNAIAQVVSDQGAAVARFEDMVFYDMFLSGSNADGPTLATTTRQVFNTTDVSKAGSNAAISITSLSLARKALRERKSLDGADLAIVPRILLVGPTKETEAEQIVGPLVPAQASNFNPFSGTLRVVTTSKITGNAWYLFADPTESQGACFVYGFLSGREAPRMRQEEPFGQLGIKMSLEHFFGCGAIDFRGGYKNAGA